MKKGELAWEYIASIILLLLLLVLFIVYSGEIKEYMLALIDKVFNFGG